jgi:hypothetical protein
MPADHPAPTGGESDEAPDAGNYDYPYDDDEPEEEQFGFECPAYWTGKEWRCPLAGTEDCDWECTETFGDEP